MPHRDLRLLSSRVLHGPNRWTWSSVLEMLIDIGELEDCPSHLLPGYPERLVRLLPSLVTHRCSIGTPGGFIQRLQEGTWPCHILEHVCLELQNLAGLPGGFGRARETHERGVYLVVVSCYEPVVTKAALEEARLLVLAAMDGHDFDIDASLARLRRLVEQHWVPAWMADAVLAAGSRGIPWKLMTGVIPGVRLGHGRYARSLWSGGSDRTSAIGSGIAADGPLCASLLADAGFDMVTSTLDEPATAARPTPASTQRWLVLGDTVLGGDGSGHAPAALGALLAEVARITGLDLVTLEVVSVPDPLATSCLAPGQLLVGSITPGLHPTCALPRPVEQAGLTGQSLMKWLFPDASRGQAFIIGCTLEEEDVIAMRVVNGLESLLKTAGHVTGVVSRHATRADGRTLMIADGHDTDSVHHVLSHHAVEAAVIETSAAKILRSGMVYEHCAIGIVSGCPAPQRLGDPHVSTAAHVSSLLRCQVDVVDEGGTAILDADDEAVAALACFCRGSVIFVSTSPAASVPMYRQQPDGKSGPARLLYRQESRILLQHNEECEVLLDMEFMPMGIPQPEADKPLLFLLAAGLALGMEAAEILRVLAEERPQPAGTAAGHRSS